MPTKEKAVSKMTVDECLKELKTLAEDVDFGKRKFTKKTSLKDLRAAVKEGREILAEAEDEEVDEEVDADASEEDTDAEEEEESDDADDEEAEEDDSDEDESEDESDEEEEEEEDEEEDEVPATASAGPHLPTQKKGTFRVVYPNGAGFRDYSEKEHGENWKILAKQHAEFKNGKLLKK